MELNLILYTIIITPIRLFQCSIKFFSTKNKKVTKFFSTKNKKAYYQSTFYILLRNILKITLKCT